ncbi:MAG: response regulator [Immundisolibacteraceae bacterium]|nr:response regulator [Immundisolibacteraceae bacterium]
MSIKEQSWISDIRRQVYNMVGLVILFIVIGASFFAWYLHASRALQKHTNEYHLASIIHYLRASDEINRFQLRRKQQPIFDDKLLNRPIISDQSSLHFIQLEIAAGTQLQAQWADRKFNALTAKLNITMANLPGLVTPSMPQVDADEKLTTQLIHTQKILTQLARLHKIERDYLMKKVLAQDERRVTSLSLFMISLLVTSILITRRGLSAIQSAIDERLESEAEKKSIETQLRQSHKMDAIGQLTGGIAHDFNNVLGIIIGNLGLLKRSVLLDGKVPKYLQNIQSAADRASNVTKKLLSFSSQQTNETVAINVNQAISSMDILTTLSINASIAVEKKLADQIWLTDINSSDFQDALLNLIINARDAMPHDGTLTITTENKALDSAYCSRHRGSTAGDYVQVTVIDTGRGMSFEEKERIFEPFYTTKPEGDGTGLGLAMVFGFVDRSAGQITVSSEPGLGSTFKLYLPRSTQLTKVEPPPAEQNQPMPRGSETILVVDDEAGLVELAKESLQALGYRVITADSAITAFEQLQAEPQIALLFSDVVMPGNLNGYELAQQVLVEKPALKVLLTSGYTKKAVIPEELSNQANFDPKLLNKPYSQLEMASQIRVLLDQP